MKPGNKLSLKLDSLAYGGDAVGRTGEFVVFAQGGLPGEKCRVTLTEVHKHFAKGEVEAVQEPSPNRVPPPCPVFGACGGCQWQMLSYPAQLEAKRAMVREALQKLGGIPKPEVAPALGMKEPWRFRNKAQFPTVMRNGTLGIGFYRRESHDLVEFDSCLIQDQALDRFRQTMKALWQAHRLPVYDERSRKPGLRHLVVRVGQGTGEVLAILVLNKGRVPEALVLEARKAAPELVGLVLNFNSRPGNVVLGERFLTLWGRDYLYEAIGPLRLRVSAGSFFQTNTQQTVVLYQQVKEMAGLRGNERVLDLYSGVGGIALFLATEARFVLGIEEEGSAYRDACENAGLNKIANVRLLPGRVERHRDALLDSDVVIVDPPRSGCSPEVLSSIARSRAERLVYVSCNPTTLARDIGFLAGKGFRLGKVVPVDIFPQSYHIEAVARLER